MQKYPNPIPRGRCLINCKFCGKRKEHEAKGACGKYYRKHLRTKKWIICKNCKRETPHHGNGLCPSCHTRLRHYDKVLANNAKKNFNIILEKYIYLTKKCQSCEFSKIVELHHLNNNKENNADTNLLGLCPNCHKMIHKHKFYKEILENIKDKYDVKNHRPKRLNKTYGKTLYRTNTSRIQPKNAETIHNNK